MDKLLLTDYTSIHEGALRKAKNQRKFADFLREHDFEFFHHYTLKELGIQLTVKPEHDNLEICILTIDGNPDPFLFYVFHMMGKRSSSIYVYLNGNYFETLHIPLAHDNHNWRKPVHGYKFPAYMTYDERKLWRYEHVKIQKGKVDKPSSFYKEHEPHVEILK